MKSDKTKIIRLQQVDVTANGKQARNIPRVYN